MHTISAALAPCANRRRGCRLCIFACAVVTVSRLFHRRIVLATSHKIGQTTRSEARLCAIASTTPSVVYKGAAATDIRARHLARIAAAEWLTAGPIFQKTKIPTTGGAAMAASKRDELSAFQARPRWSIDR